MKKLNFIVKVAHFLPILCAVFFFLGAVFLVFGQCAENVFIFKTIGIVFAALFFVCYVIDFKLHNFRNMFKGYNPNLNLAPIDFNKAHDLRDMFTKTESVTLIPPNTEELLPYEQQILTTFLGNRE